MTPPKDRGEFIVTLRPERQAHEERRNTAVSPLLIVLAAVIVPIALAFGSAMADEVQILGVVLAAIGLIVILAQPFYGLLFFVALLYTRPEEAIPALADMHFTLVVSVVTLIGMWFQMFTRRQAFVRPPFVAMVVAFGLLAILSGVQDDNLNQAAQDIGRLVILVILIMNLVRTPAQYRIFVSAVLIFTAYLAGYSAYLYFTGRALTEQTGNTGNDFLRAQATGIFNDPNDVASTIAAGLGLALSRLPGASKIMRPFYILLAAGMVWAIFLTNSRGGMLALMAVIFGFFFIALKNKKVAILLGVLAALGALTLGSGHMTNFDASEASANSRFHFWHTAFDVLVQHPLLGVGYDGFMSLNDGATAHNSFALCYAETGLLGYFFWMGALYYCFRKPPRATEEAGLEEKAARGTDTEARDLLGARLGLVGYLVASFWLSHTYEPVMYVLMPLPILAQTCRNPAVNIYKGIAPWKDWRNIAILALGSILFIEILADHYISK